jgi:hypothetical protein
MRRPTISLSSVLGWVCRVSGCTAAVLLVRVSLSFGLVSSPSVALLQVAMALIVSVLIGTIVTECAFALSEAVVTAFNRPFFRKSVKATGRIVSEIWFPGGTWIRSETWKNGAAWEWTERDGSCTRIEFPAMTVVRAGPPRSWNAVHQHGPLYDLRSSATRSGNQLPPETLNDVDRYRRLDAQADAVGGARSTGVQDHRF